MSREGRPASLLSSWLYLPAWEGELQRPRYTNEGLLTRRAARRVLRPYAVLLSRVISDAWDTWHQLGAEAPAARMKMGRSARAITLADFIKDAVESRFARVRGCSVQMEYGRPVLVLASGDLRLRLGKIDLDQVPYPRNDRQLMIWSQAEAVANKLPFAPSGTWAKCGYVLDETETRVTTIVVKCDLDGALKWTLALPVPTASRLGTGTAPLVTPSVPSARIASASPTSTTASGHASSST